MKVRLRPTHPVNTLYSQILLAEAFTRRNTDGPPQGVIVFMVFWLILGVGNFLFFHFNRDAALKRRVLPIIVILAGLIFSAFLYFMVGDRQPQILFLMIPAIVIITLLNLRTIRFCDACGRTLYRQSIIRATKFCPHCGSELK